MEFNDKLDSAMRISMVDILSESQLKAIGRTFISSADVENLFNSNNIPHMIIGAHAIGEITSEPRATQDVDVVVRDSDYNKAIALILDKYPGTHDDGNRIKDQNGNVLIDVLTDKHPIYKTAMARGGRIPSAEMALVMKFLSSKSPLRRKDKKLQDKADFFNIAGKVQVDTNKILDLLAKSDEEFIIHKDEIIDWINEAK